MKAKNLSIAGKISSVVFIIAAYIITACTSHKIPSGDEVFGMLQVSAFIAMSFLPIDISVIVERIKGMKDVAKN